MKKTVLDVIRDSSKPFATLQADDLVIEALKFLETYDIGAVMVFEGPKLVGIFSERDYARKVELKNRSSAKTKIKEVMSKDIFAISPDRSIEDCLGLMNSGHFRHLPVVAGNQVLGFISILDIARTLLSEKLEKIDQLEKQVSEHWPF